MYEIGIFVGFFVVSIYIWLTWNYNYWRKLNIPYLEPSLIYGNLKDVVLMKKTRGIVYHDLYRKGKEPVLGIFSMRQPQWLIRDPALMKVLTINEFSNFRENDTYTEPHDFFFTTNVFFFSGEEWKRKRGIITPALTMNKLKLFIPYMVDVCKEMMKYLDDNADKALEAKSFTGLYTIETAMSYVYGVKCNSYKEPNSQYRKVFNEIFDPNWWNGFKFTIASAFPPVGHFFRIGLTPKSFIEFYLNVVKETVEYKKKNNLKRKDFLQFLIDESQKQNTPELSIFDMTGLTMNLAADGTETTSAGLTCVMDALLRYPEQQAILREEIDKVINNIDDINYDNISSIPYLTAFISESLRILTPVPLLEKKCTNNCEVSFNGRQYKFKKGDKIALPIHSFHTDPKYFPNPDEFRPERFLESEDHVGFGPFGNGPRMCLGRSFAYVQMKIFICALLKFYEILPKGDKAPPIEFEPKSIIFLMVKGGVWFRAKRR